MDARKTMSGDHRYRRRCDHCPARHIRRTTLAEAVQHLRLADCPWRYDPGAERGLCRADSGTAVPEDLCVRRGVYGWDHPGVRCPSDSRRVREPRTTFPATGPVGADAMESRCPTKICQALTGRRRIDSVSMWEGGDGKVGGTYGVDQRLHRTKPELFQRRVVYSQGAIPLQAEGTCPHYECDQSRPSAEWRIHYRTWIVSRVGRNPWGSGAWATTVQAFIRNNWGKC